MRSKKHIPFNELLVAVRQLSPSRKIKLQRELIQDAKPINKKSRLTKLLLEGPVFTDEQIKIIEETRKSINEWRKNPYDEI